MGDRDEMRNLETGAVAAVSEVTAVHLDKRAHKSCPFPHAIRASAAARLSGEC